MRCQGTFFPPPPPLRPLLPSLGVRLASSVTSTAWGFCRVGPQLDLGGLRGHSWLENFPRKGWCWPAFHPSHSPQRMDGWLDSKGAHPSGMRGWAGRVRKRPVVSAPCKICVCLSGLIFMFFYLFVFGKASFFHPARISWNICFCPGVKLGMSPNPLPVLAGKITPQRLHYPFMTA